MTECNNNITLNDIPTCTDVDNQGYLIVQNTDSTCKVKISDLVFGVENVDFYPELINIITQLETLTTIVSENSANWNQAYTTTNTNSATWSQIDSMDLVDVGTVVKLNSATWDDTTAVVYSNSAFWNTAYVELTSYSSQWNDGLATLNIYPDYGETIGVVQTLSGQWNIAYNHTLD